MSTTQMMEYVFPSMNVKEGIDLVNFPTIRCNHIHSLTKENVKEMMEKGFTEVCYHENNRGSVGLTQVIYIRNPITDVFLYAMIVWGDKRTAKKHLKNLLALGFGNEFFFHDSCWDYSGYLRSKFGKHGKIETIK